MGRYLIALILCLTLVVAVFSPADAGRIKKGTTEFVTDSRFERSSVSFDGDGIGSITNLGLSFGFGYFVTEMFEFGTSLLVNHASVDPDGGSSSSATQVGVTGVVFLNIPVEGPAVPFFGLAVGVLNYSGDGFDDTDISAVLPRISGGSRFLIGNSASLNLSAAFQHVTNVNGSKDFSSNDFSINFGMSIFVTGGAAE